MKSHTKILKVKYRLKKYEELWNKIRYIRLVINKSNNYDEKTKNQT